MTTVEQYTVKKIAEDGTYRAFPLAWTLEQAESGAVAIAIKFAVHSKWHGKEVGWSEQFPIGWFTEARIWVVKKPKDGQVEGSLADGAIKNLRTCGLWDGDWDKLELPPPAVYVLVDVESEEFDGRMQHRVSWVNPDADEPKPRGQFAPVDRGLLNTLRTKHQARTRALAGGSPATGAPPPPPTFVQPGPPVAPAVPGLPPAPSHPAPHAAPPAPPAVQAPQVTQPPAWGGPVSTAQPTRPPLGPPPMVSPSPAPPPAFDPEKTPF